MIFEKKKTSLFVGLLVLITAFVGMQTPVAASGEPPVADAGGPYTGEECRAVVLNASGSYDPEGDVLTYRWNISGLWIDNYYYPYMEWTWFDDFSGIITLEVSDGTLTDTDTIDVTIANVPPQILSIDGPTEVDAGAEFALFVNFNAPPDSRDPIAYLDTYIATFSWGDGCLTELSLAAEEVIATASHIYESEGFYHIGITIVDKDGGEASVGWDVMVGDIALVEAGPDGFIDEGSMFVSSGFLLDTDGASYSALVDFYDETGPEPLLLNPGNSFDLAHCYLDDGFYTLLVTVFNEEVEYASDTANVTVNNVPPSIESLSVSPTDPVRPGAVVDLTVMFSDPGRLDAHTATIQWGDGTSVQYSLEAGTTVVHDSHSYANAGDYTITVTLIDDDDGADTASMFVSVKNPTNPTDALKTIIIGLKIPKGMKNTLLSLIDDVPHLLKHHKVRAVIHQLQAFIHFVQAQSSKKLPREQAKELIHSARVIIDALRQR